MFATRMRFAVVRFGVGICHDDVSAREVRFRESKEDLACVSTREVRRIEIANRYVACCYWLSLVHRVSIETVLVIRDTDLIGVGDDGVSEMLVRSIAR